MPAATAAAEPDDEPPGTRSGAFTFTGVPSKAFSPRMPSETSSVMVLPISVAPPSSSVCTAKECCAGIGRPVGQSWLPPPVGTPATSNRSLAAKVRPASGPPALPSMRTRGPGTKAPMSSLMEEASLLGGMRCGRDLVLAPEDPELAELHAEQAVEPHVDDRRDEQREALRHQQSAHDG